VNSLGIFVQALGIAYAAGLNLYATVAIVGLASRLTSLPELPGTLAAFGDSWVITVAVALYVFGFAANLVPGICSAWETVHSLIRPPAAAALAATAAAAPPELRVGWAVVPGQLTSIIFAISILMLPQQALSWFGGANGQGIAFFCQGFQCTRFLGGKLKGGFV